MAQQSEAWVDEYGNDFIGTILRDDFHAVNFSVDGEHYTFSGWWLLEWEYGNREYNTKEEFINDPVFDGKTIAEVDIKRPEFEMQS